MTVSNLHQWRGVRGAHSRSKMMKASTVLGLVSKRPEPDPPEIIERMTHCILLCTLAHVILHSRVTTLQLQSLRYISSEVISIVCQSAIIRFKHSCSWAWISSQKLSTLQREAFCMQINHLFTVVTLDANLLHRKSVSWCICVLDISIKHSPNNMIRS